MMIKGSEIAALPVICLPPATKGPLVLRSFWALGDWISKVHFPVETQFLRYTGRNRAIHSFREPRSFTGPKSSPQTEQPKTTDTDNQLLV